MADEDTGSAVADYLLQGGGGATQTPAQKARASVGIAIGDNPDFEAELKRAATITGVPLDSARAEPDVVKNQAKVSAFDFDNMAAKFPATAKHLSSVENARIAHDDTESLTAIEGALPKKSIGQSAIDAPMEVVKGLGGSFNRLGTTVNVTVGAFPVAYDYVKSLITGKQTTDAEDAYFRGMVDPLIQKQQVFEPDANARLGEKAANATGGAIGMLSEMVLTGGESVALKPAEITIPRVVEQVAEHSTKSMAVPSIDSAVTKGREVLQQTGDSAAAVKAAVASYAATTVTGVIPANAPGGIVKRMLTGLGLGPLSGEAAHVIEEAGTPESMQRDLTLDDRVVSAIVGGVLGIAGPSAAHDGGRAEQAHTDTQALEQIAKVAEASKLRERDPASFEEFVKDAAKDGPVKDLYIDAKVYAETLEQKGLDPEQLSPTAAKELAAQVIAGGDVRIPVEEFATRMPGTGLDQSLLEHFKTDPLGMSKKEAETYYQNFATEQRAEAEKILGERQGDEAFQQSHEAVKTKIVEQLAQANRFTPDVNKSYATLMSSFYTTQAARLGITPEKMYQRYPLSIRAESVLGSRQMDQGFVSSMVPDVVYHGSKDDIVEFDTTKTVDGGFHFGTESQAKMRNRRNVIAAYIDLKNPQRSRDVGGNWKSKIAQAKKAGYDGIVYLNRYEGVSVDTVLLAQREGVDLDKLSDAQFRKYVPEVRDSYIVFDKHQIKINPIAKAKETGYDAENSGNTYGQSSRHSDPFGNPDEVVHSTVAGTPATEGWARATRLRGNDGQPAPFFRGASRPLSAGDFNPEALGHSTGNPSSGLGVFFTISGKEAQRWGTVSEYRLDVRNPKVINVEDLPGFESVEEAHAWRESLRAEGFDGIVVTAKHVGGKVHAVAFSPEQVIKPANTLEQPVYHGSPHDFTKFELSDKTIGTGEGAQAYGHGLYFAENPEVAKSYHRALAEDPDITEFKLGPYLVKRGDNWADYSPRNNTALENVRASITEDLLIDEHGLRTAESIGKLRDYVLDKIDEKIASYKDEWPEGVKAAEQFRAMMAKPGAIKFKVDKVKGGVYQVDIPDEHVDKMLLWDKPLSEQPDNVKEALRDLGDTSEKNAEYDDALLAALDSNDKVDLPKAPKNPTGEDMYVKLMAKLGSDKAASQYLKSKGIPGLKYLDQGSRNNGDGSHNIVVFDDSILTVTHKDGSPLTAKERKEFLQIEGGGDARGQISFGDEISQGATISLLHNADLSTFLHESGHFYLEVLNDLATRADAIPEMQQDMGALLKWFGVKDLDTWNSMTLEEKRPYHEQFARGFESYLFEGRAPSVELNSLFSKFRAWMVNVYKQLSALNVSLTPEVRGVMDRLIATNQEIVAAEAQRGFEPLFKTAEAVGMSADEWASYQKLGQEATQSAVDQLQSRSVRDMQWLDNAKSGKLRELQRDAATKRKAVMAEVTAETRAEPVYAAQRFLKHGETIGPDGEQIQATEGYKLSLPALREMYPPGELGALDYSKLGHGKYGMTANDGLHPDMVAEIFGFSSGDEMVRKILDAEPERAVIEGKTDQRMLERYGDLSSPQAIERATNAAIHNDARSRFIATELAAVEKAVGSKRTLAKAAREFAHQIIARTKIKELKPSRFEAAEARAAKASERGKDLTEKATQKRNQLINNYAAKAAYEAGSDVEKGARYLNKFDNANTRKSLDTGYTDQIDALLERYDLRSSVSNRDAAKRASLNEWIESQRDLGYEPQIPDSVLADAQRKPYREMTVEEFRGLVDAVKNIEHLGRLKKKLLTAKDQRDFDEVKGLLAGTIRETAKNTLPEARVSDRGALVSIGRLFKGFLASHRKFASFARQFDGWQDGGPVWDHLVRNMNERGDFEAVEREKATIKLHELLDPLIKGGKLGDKKFYPSSGKSFTREERLGMALNMGNEINRERVMTGEKLTPQQLHDVLNDLSKSDWDGIQSIWDYFDSFRPQMAAKQKRLTGTEPEWVEASGVNTPHGSYRGGYYPIKYDPLRSARSEADINAEVAKQIERGLYVQAQTRKGHLKARTESTGRPLRYDLGVIAEHVDQVVHDLAWHEYLIDANRLLRSGAIEDAIRTHYGPEVHNQMKETLKDIALGDLGAQTAGDRMLNWVRHGTTISGLGLNVANTIINTIGITQSIVRVGPQWVAKGMRHWASDAVGLESSAKKIYAMSDFMRLRAKTQMREINELRNTIATADSKLKQAYGKLLPAFFYLQTKSQQLVDIPTWWGAYEKAMAEPEMTQERASALADQAVIDAQGSGMTKDLAGIQRGGSPLKLFTTFYHFFNTTYNLTAEAVGRTNFRKPTDVSLLAADIALLYTVPALMQTVVMSLLKDETDDKEKLTKRLLSDQVSYLLAPVVLARDATAGAQAALGVDSGMGYTGPASIRFFSDFYNLGKQVHQGEPDEAFWKSLDNVGGVLFHYPAGQINRTAAGIAALNDGRTTNPAALLVGPSSSR